MYRGRCIGRVLHFLRAYCKWADQMQIGDGKVFLHDKVFATFAWDTSFGLKDVPTFRFCGEDASFFNEQQLLQKERAIEDGLSLGSIEVLEIYKDFRWLKAMNERAHRDMMLWSEISHKTGPMVYLGEINGKEQRLFFGAGNKEYIWDSASNEWLLYAQNLS